MPKLIFKFDKEKDLWNHWHKSNWKSSWTNFKIDTEIRKICERKKFEECKEELSNHLSKLQNSKLVLLEINSLKKFWEIIQEEFFKKMDNLMKNKFEKDIIAYLTTAGICPYDPDEPSFMFSLFYSLPHQLQTCGHEIMHLYFHKFYWDKVESQIGKEKTGDLKEALTILLNLEFKNLWFAKDYGYEPHKELRSFILEEWKKEKDFEKLLEKCISYLKTK
jgi:hypothetical protein